MATHFRTKQILVSSAVYDALKVLADIEGHDCPDSVADLRLGLLLSNEAEIQWAISERSRRMKKFREDYLQHVAAKKPEAAPAAPWKSAICHYGTSMKGKALEAIFLTGSRVPKTAKELDLLTAWFKDQITDSEEDKALWTAVQAADAEIRAGFPKPHEAATPANVMPGTETAPRAEKPAQQPAAPTGWREFVIPGRSPDWSGKTLGSLMPAQLKQCSDEYVSLIEIARATPQQKMLKAQMALAMAELFPKSDETEVYNEHSLPLAEDFDHVKALNDLIKGNEWDEGFFITVCKLNRWIPESVRKIEDISAESFEGLESGWATVEEEMAKAHQPAQQP